MLCAFLLFRCAYVFGTYLLQIWNTIVLMQTCQLLVHKGQVSSFLSVVLFDESILPPNCCLYIQHMFLGIDIFYGSLDTMLTGSPYWLYGC
jgi:hypothetical protein